MEPRTTKRQAYSNIHEHPQFNLLVKYLIAGDSPSIAAKRVNPRIAAKQVRVLRDEILPDCLPVALPGSLAVEVYGKKLDILVKEIAESKYIQQCSVEKENILRRAMYDALADGDYKGLSDLCNSSTTNLEVLAKAENIIKTNSGVSNETNINMPTVIGMPLPPAGYVGSSKTVEVKKGIVVDKGKEYAQITSGSGMRGGESEREGLREDASEIRPGGPAQNEGQEDVQPA